MPDHAFLSTLCFRYGTAFTVYGGLQQLPGGPKGAECATWRWRGCEVLCQLVRGAELLLAEGGKKTDAMLTVAESSLCFWKLDSLSSSSLSRCDLFISFFSLISSHPPQISVGLLALFKDSVNCLFSSNTNISVSFHDFLKPVHSPCLLYPHLLHKRSAVFKWPVGLGSPLTGDCTLPTYRGLIV